MTGTPSRSNRFWIAGSVPMGWAKSPSGGQGAHSVRPYSGPPSPTRIDDQALAGRRESRKRGLRRIPVWAIKLIGTLG